MIKLDPKNGVHIYPTPYAIDRHVSTDEEIKKTYVRWRLLEINRYTQLYNVVTVSSDPLQIIKELVCAQMVRSRHFRTPTELIDTFCDFVFTCQSAVEGIQQHAAINQVKHG